jgi:membrane protein YqaA with SNARE-associated domain
LNREEVTTEYTEHTEKRQKKNKESEERGIQNFTADRLVRWLILPSSSPSLFFFLFCLFSATLRVPAVYSVVTFFSAREGA